MIKRFFIGCTVIILELSQMQNMMAQIQTRALPDPGFEDRIEKVVANIRIIDTHEHLRTLEGILDDTSFDFMHLFHQYIKYDLISSGMSPEIYEEMNNMDIPLKDRWEKFKPWWEAARFTAYGREPLIAANDLYDIPDINDDTYQELSKRINDSMSAEWYVSVLKEKAKIDISILDRGHKQFDEKLFVHSERFDNFIYVFSYAEIEKLGLNYDIKINNLEDYVLTLEKAFQEGVDFNMVSVKSALAYKRIIRYDKVLKEDAEKVFEELLKAKDTSAKFDFNSVKPLQDYMMHSLLSLINKYKLPFQVHTGLHVGNGNVITNSKPTHLDNLFGEYPDVKFCIFHGSYPYGGELSVLAKNFPNVYIDMCWMYLISPSYSERYLHEWIETVPANKIMAFGGDDIHVESVYAHSIMARRLIAKVMIEKVKSGYLTEEEAINIIHRILRDNAIEVYQLEDKIGNYEE